MLIDAPRQRPHLVAASSQQLHRDGAHAAGRARDQHRTLGGVLVQGPLEPRHRQRSRVAGGADRGRVRRAEALRHADHVGGVNAQLRRVSAVAALADAAAVDGDQRAVVKRAHRVNARHCGQVAQDAAVAAQCHRVLVVDGRVADVNQRVALARELVARLDDLRSLLCNNQRACHAGKYTEV